MDILYEIVVDGFAGLSIRKIPFLIACISFSLIANLILLRIDTKDANAEKPIRVLVMMFFFTGVGMMLEMYPVVGIGLSILGGYIISSSNLGLKKAQPKQYLHMLISVISGAGFLFLGGLLLVFSILVIWFGKRNSSS